MDDLINTMMRRPASWAVLARWSTAGAAALTLLVPLPAAADGNCFLSCLASTDCRVDNLPSTLNAGTTSASEVACQRLGIVSAGPVEAITRFRGRIHSTTAARDQNLGHAFRKLPGADCVFADLACRAARDDAMVAGRAGKAFEGQAGFPLSGSPCALGLPCGIVVGSAEGWRIELIQPTGAPTEFEIVGLRGSNTRLTVPVVRDTLRIPAGLTQAGASYSYALRGAGGTVIAAGQFAVAAPSVERDLKDAEQAAVARGRSPDTARLEALLVNELDWDAMRWVRR